MIEAMRSLVQSHSVEIQSSETERKTPSARWQAYAELTKLRISIMVLVMFIVAGLIAAGPPVNLLQLFYASVGMLLIAASGNAMSKAVRNWLDTSPRT